MRWNPGKLWCRNRKDDSVPLRFFDCRSNKVVYSASESKYMSQFTRSLLSLSLILFLGVAFLLQELPGASGQEKSNRQEPSVVSAKERAEARISFKDKCSRCHGSDGKGNTVLGDLLFPPDFTDGKWWKELSNEQIMQSITNGKNEMPPFGKKLTKTEILALIVYVRCFGESAASDKRKACD